MSSHVCLQCGHEEALFGTGGGERLASTNGLALLGRLPLNLSIREASDSGKPIVISDPESAAAAAYRNIAREMTRVLASQQQSNTVKFPDIVVEH